MERRLSAMTDLGYEENPVVNVKVVMTTLAFDNTELILKLRQRGTAIKNSDWQKVHLAEREIN